MVGHQVLALAIGVRVPASEHTFDIAVVNINKLKLVTK